VKTPKKPTWKSLAQLNPKDRKLSWDKFISEAYCEVELES